MSEQQTFKRYEIKYLLTQEEKRKLLFEMEEYMCADIHGRSTIFSLYCDTPDFLLARRSMEHPLYKEKFRLRSYGVASHTTPVFIELKKKYNAVVYKRRIVLPENAAMHYVQEDILPELSEDALATDRQIFREIHYSHTHYMDLKPRILLSYERDAFYAKDDPEFRVTFDQNILWRDTDVNLTTGVYGQPLLGEEQSLMEVKAGGAIPLWFVHLLTSFHLYKTTFSKYGSAYQQLLTTNASQNAKENTHYDNIISGDFRFHPDDNHFRSNISAMRVHLPSDRCFSGSNVCV